MIHADDITESVLNIGVLATSERYGITPKEVIEIAKPFTDEIDSAFSNCVCEEAYKHDGTVMMCFHCPKYRRL